MSRRAVIYCRGVSAKEAREATRRLRELAKESGWAVFRAYTDGQAARGAQWKALWRKIAAREVDLLVVPSFSAIADNVPDALKEILRLRDAGCDLYVADAALDTTSPVDRVLFRVAEALSALDTDTPDHARRRRQPRKVHREPTPGQRSLIRAALAAGLSPNQVARSLKLPLGLVRSVQASDEG